MARVRDGSLAAASDILQSVSDPAAAAQNERVVLTVVTLARDGKVGDTHGAMQLGDAFPAHRCGRLDVGVAARAVAADVETVHTRRMEDLQRTRHAARAHQFCVRRRSSRRRPPRRGERQLRDRLQVDALARLAPWRRSA